MQQQTPNVHKRFYALDGLRATMMLLGVVIHSVISYGAIEYGRGWGYDDTATTPVADLIVIFIHVFRMPIFFVLAGFFAALLYLRRGPAGLARNRVVRIVIPFVIGWAVLFPLVAGGFVFANTAQAVSIAAGLAAVREGIAQGYLLFGNSTMHLWFLYDLIYFYAAALLLAPLIMRLPAAWRENFLRAFDSIVSRPLLRLVVLSALTVAVLLPVGGNLQTSARFVPDIEVLLAYSFFFGFGWLLYLQRGVLSSIGRFAWTQTLTGAVIFLIALSMIAAGAGGDGGPRPLSALAGSAMGAVVVWLLFFGFTGLFLRYLDRPSATVRYVVDSSYWIYLIHLPFTIWIPGLLSNVAWSPWAKLFVVLSATIVIGVVTYDLLVRSSAIGALLNGRRYPRGLPSLELIEPVSQHAR